MRDKILIIKLEALGDVLRTTPILRCLKGEITWVTKKKAIPLLAENPFIANLIDINQKNILKNKVFDLLINIDEADEACNLASQTRAKTIIGAYIENNKKFYTNSSASWFDMSLISKHGLKKANALKRKNLKSYQEHLFAMLGKKFGGEEYILNSSLVDSSSDIIGIEKNVGQIWPLKRWSGYEVLAQKLREDGFKVKIFQWRRRLSDYISDISRCRLIVCGDTLAMHIALALKKKVIALFGPTYAEEIYDYSRMTKIKCPTSCYGCYMHGDINRKNCIDAIRLDTVYMATKSIVDNE